MCQGLTQWALVPFGLTIKQTIIHKHDNVTNKIMKQHKKINRMTQWVLVPLGTNTKTNNYSQT